MNPEKQNHELNMGRVLTKEEEQDILLLIHGFGFLRNHYDFLRDIPWARSDN